MIANERQSLKGYNSNPVKKARKSYKGKASSRNISPGKLTNLSPGKPIKPFNVRGASPYSERFTGMSTSKKSRKVGLILM
jgi:hypothetical protein